ncbi:MAG TPA: NAD(P)/FAD-dependent oxidoreductase [Candidatus Acidoferrales bacterium]|jgi:NADH dehydrogenase|nr:NAD(P)/FAD-dependent oxidoreductase [Candidatus Acidoferrales bacterium]
MLSQHRVVIVGGGFGGLSAALTLKSAPVQVTLVDRCNYHLFQPLLYQVATGTLSPANIASPLRNILKRHKNTRVLLAEATRIDSGNRRVILSDGSVEYDSLIVSTGSSHQYFGHDQWEQFAPGLKTIEDATDMRRRILLAFETAERESDPEKLRAWMTFVIVGGGPTGAELAGALGEIANDTLRRDFRNIDPSKARIILVEGTDRVLPVYPPKLSASARTMIERLGVTVRTSAIVTNVDGESVTVREGDRSETIPTRTILWAAGVLGSPLGRILAQETGATIDKAGRVAVEPDLTVPGHPEIFVIGDLANFVHQTGKPLPGVAQPAIQEGRYAAKVIARRLRGEKSRPFHYLDKGNLATIGRGAAVADLNWLRLSGFPAWLLWIFVHLMYIVEFQNRLLVFVQWAWFYFTYDRSARLITGKNPLPLDL